jgi:hypothetical protein
LSAFQVAYRRLQRFADDAACVHDSKAKALKILWHRITPQLKPVGCTLTDADAYRWDATVSYEGDAFAVDALMHAELVADPDGLYGDGRIAALDVIDHLAVPALLQARIISCDDGMYYRGLVDARAVIDHLLLRPRLLP